MPIENTENQRRLEEHLTHCREVFCPDEVSRAWRAVGDGDVLDFPPLGGRNERRSAPFRTQNEAVGSGLAADLLTVVEAAKYLRVSVSAIRRLQQGRRVAFIKIGGSLRFARSDLAAYLVKRRITPIE